MDERRDEFLLEIYRQASSHLNRHILVTWQSIGVVAAALAVFVFGGKQDAPPSAHIDFIVSAFVVLCAWAIAHLYDAGNWFERNLHIITNVERQFLTRKDASEIHFYFLSHRQPKLIAHLRIQLAMVETLWAVVLLYHLYARVYPVLRNFSVCPEWVVALPYLTSVAGWLYCRHVERDRRLDYEKLRSESPGRAVADQGEYESRTTTG